MRFPRAALILFLGGIAAPAQDPVFQFKVDVPLVSLDVTVTDPRGRPISSLTAKDFIILEDGEEQQIQSFTAMETPYNILLLFDRSGSTERLWTTMQRSAERFVRNLRPQDRAAVAAFDEGLMMLSGWNDSRAATQRAVDEI